MPCKLFEHAASRLRRGGFASVRRRSDWRLAAAAVCSAAAHADLWAYVDGRSGGHRHFAAEALDDRFKLFFRAMSTDSSQPWVCKPEVGFCGQGLNARTRMQSFSRSAAL